MNKYLDIAPEVAAALADGRPVVALESTIISHGMPYPENVKTALAVEKIIRDNGAVPDEYKLPHFKKHNEPYVNGSKVYKRIFIRRKQSS
jgi:hypothetical protein